MCADKIQCVLVVDDHSEILKFIEFNLTFSGFEVITASSGVEALTLLESVKPDIMLLDVALPHLSGLEVLYEMRAFTRLPVIVLSSDVANREAAIQLGADDFMEKPIEFTELLARIKKLLVLQPVA